MTGQVGFCKFQEADGACDRAWPSSQYWGGLQACSSVSLGFLSGVEWGWVH